MQQGSSAQLAAKKEFMAKLEDDRREIERAIDLVQKSGQELASNEQQLRRDFPGVNTRDVENTNRQYDNEQNRLKRTPGEINQIFASAGSIV